MAKQANFQEKSGETLDSANVALSSSTGNVDFILDARFTRQGDDLMLQRGDEAVIVRDYFADEKPPLEFEGLTLSPEMVSSFLETPTELYAAAVDVEANSTGTVSNLEGQAYAIRNGARIELKANDAVYKGDTIETAQGASIEMIFADGTKFSLGGDARLSIDEFIYDAASNEGSQAVSLLKGAFSFASGLIAKDDPTNMVVQTVIGEIGIRGTKVVGDINPGGDSFITVIEGRVLLSNEGGSIELSQGFATARVTSAVVAPEAEGVITVAEAVQRYVAIFNGGNAELAEFIEAEIPEVEIVEDADESGAGEGGESGEGVDALEVASLSDGTQIANDENLILEENLTLDEDFISTEDFFTNLDNQAEAVEAAVENVTLADVQPFEFANVTNFVPVAKDNEFEVDAPIGPQIFDGVALRGLIEDPTGQGTVSYATADATVTAYLAVASSNSGEALGDSYTGIVNLIGSDYGDALGGTSGVNELFGRAGVDTLIGLGGADRLEGGDNNDIFFYLADDFLNGGVVTAMDTITDIEVGDTVSFESMGTASEDDFIFDGTRLYFNTNGNMMGDAGEEIIEFLNLDGEVDGDITPGGGGSFSITNIRELSAQTFIGTSAIDIFTDRTGAGTVSYAGSGGTVQVFLEAPASNAGDAMGDSYTGIVNIIGGSANDILVGAAGANEIEGGTGADTLRGRAGADRLTGDAGIDTFGYAQADLDGSMDTITDIAVNEVISFTGMTTASEASFIVDGNRLYYDANSDGTADADEAIVEFEGKARLAGVIEDTGSDNFEVTINEIDSADSLDGSDEGLFFDSSGAGTVSYASSTGAVTASLESGIGTVGDATGDSYTGIANLIGGGGNDRLIGDGEDNEITGGVGNDWISGAGGADVLTGGLGTDTFSLWDGTEGLDVITDIEVGDEIRLDETFTDRNRYEFRDGALYLNGDAVVEFEGYTTLSTTYIPIPGDSAIVFTVTGGILDGAYLDGAIVGSTGIDTVSYEGSTGAVTASLESGIGTVGDAMGDSYTDIVNIIGGSGNDILEGDDEANEITGGAGVDTLEGGMGRDIFSYELADLSATDTITDIQTGDTLTFTGMGMATVADFNFIDNQLLYAGSAIVEFSSFTNPMGGLALGDVTDDGGGSFTITNIREAFDGSTYTGLFDGTADGIDTVSYADSTTTVRVNLEDLSLNNGDAIGDTYTGIVNIIGGRGADVLNGDDEDNRIEGGDGVDTIYGGDGTDVIYGGAGGDTLRGNDGEDTLIGGAGDDELLGGDGDDILTGGMGRDTFSYSDNNGRDTITDIENNEIVFLVEVSGDSSNFEFQGNTLRFDSNYDTFFDESEIVFEFEGYTTVEGAKADTDVGEVTITINTLT